MGRKTACHRRTLLPRPCGKARNEHDSAIFGLLQDKLFEML